MKINIDNPCSEKWENMKDSDQGKFCEKCCTNIIDFTDKSDDELSSIFSTNENICGRFRTSQLNINFDFLKLRAFASIMLASGIITYMQAQKIDSICGFTVSNSSQKSITLGSPRLAKKTKETLVIIDNVSMSVSALCQLPNSLIKNIIILKSDEAEKKYGLNGKNGAIIVETVRKLKK